MGGDAAPQRPNEELAHRHAGGVLADSRQAEQAGEGHEAATGEAGRRAAPPGGDVREAGFAEHRRSITGQEALAPRCAAVR